MMQYVFMRTARQNPKLYDVHMTVKSTNPLSLLEIVKIVESLPIKS